MEKCQCKSSSRLDRIRILGKSKYSLLLSQCWCGGLYRQRHIVGPAISWIQIYDFGTICLMVDISLFNWMYGLGKCKGIGNWTLRNVNSSSGLTRMICFLSNSCSCSEWYSESSCDDLLLESYSMDPDLVPELFSMMSDMLLFRVQEQRQVSAAHLDFVPVEFRIRDAVNWMGKTILAQVHCLRFTVSFLGNDRT